MKKSRSIRRIFLFLLFPMITLPPYWLFSAYAIMSTQTSLRSTGTILETEAFILIYPNFSESIGTNKLVVGSQVHYWMELQRNSILRQQIADAKMKVMRVFIHFHAGTGGYQNYNPCLSWDETTKTGTWNWTLFDSYMTSIYETGAIPLICLNIEWPRYGAPSGMVTDELGLPSPESYAAYARAVAEHMKSKGWNNTIWEVFNEVFTKWNFWPLGEIYTDQNRAKWDKIITVFNAVSQAIHGVIPNAKVGETSTQYKGWCETVAEKGIGVDFVGHHKYDSGNAPEERADDQELFERAVNGQGVHSGNPDIRWLPEEVFDIFAQHGKYPEFYITETALNHDWDPQDYRKFTPLGAVWYATELIDFAKRGISLSMFYTVASNMGSDYPEGFGMVELWGSHRTWYPYYTTMLFAKNLFPGDELKQCSTDSSNISCLAWSHGSEYKVLLVHKTPDNVTVFINFEGLTAGVHIDRLEDTGNPYTGALNSQSLGISNNGCKVTMNGYSLIVVSFSSTS